MPALEALLSAALEREALLGGVVETAALRRADTVKTALLRAVSHDLRSPLTAISAAGEAVGSPSLSRRRARGDGGGDPGGDPAALAAGRQPARPLAAGGRRGRAAPGVDLGRGADRARRSRSSRAGPGEFSLSIDRDLPLVSVDPVQMERAFVNVLENARRHSRRAPVSVARARGAARLAGAAAGDRVIVRIVDRGPGIPPAQLERVFEPFYRAGTASGATAARGWGWRSPAASPRPTAARCTSSRCPGRARRSCSSCRSTAARRATAPTPRGRATRAGAGADLAPAQSRRRRRAPSAAGVTPTATSAARRRRAARARRRRRAADRARAEGRAARGRLRGGAAETAAEALDLRPCARREAAIVDLVLPDGDGVEVTRSLREWSEMPILVLSAVGEEEQKVQGARGRRRRLRHQAVRRARAGRAPAGGAAPRRRRGREEEPRIAVDGLEIDLAARVVRRDGEPIHLTPIEFDLLRVLVRNRGRLMTHRKLLAEVWGPGVRRRHPAAAHAHRAAAREDRAARRGAGRATSSPIRASVTASPGLRRRAAATIGQRRAAEARRHEIVMRARADRHAAVMRRRQ